MAKVITFSRAFPIGHPRAKQPTYFVEKVFNSFLMCGYSIMPKSMPLAFLESLSKEEFHAKHHTIRAGNRFKVGDKFSPRVWSGQPYRSPQITIAPDIEIKKIWDFEIKNFSFYLNGKSFYVQHSSEFHTHLELLAKNDGLSVQDLFAWFKIPCEFKGQIICWNQNVNY